MFLAPPSDRDDQDQDRAGPSEVALGKQVAHYNSDDRDNGNAYVANAVNTVARHTRDVTSGQGSQVDGKNKASTLARALE